VKRERSEGIQPKRLKAKQSTVRLAGRDVSISNLDKVMYPETGFTKGQVIDYYARVARYILPHLRDRPITMKRFPDGIHGEYFYEKDAPSFTPDWIKTYPVPRTSGKSNIDYILINDLPTLVWSANMANLEIHPFLARVPDLEKPTMMVFDLDPGPQASILQSCEVAFLVKALLDQMKLKSLVKVSGSKGIHLHVPLNSNVSYAMTQSLARSIAQFLEREHPGLIVSDMAKVKRKGKVFIDWSQNSVHKSTVAVYSLRAKGERPFVAMPIAWSELKRAVKKDNASMLFFEPEAALKRIEKTGDRFAFALTLKQKLPGPFLEIESDIESESPSESTGLESYRQKRDFTKTPEPAPSRRRPSRQRNRRLFVIQKHAASRLHYDFRLEIVGTLKSWALPKGPPYDLSERRLAMATEDHPIEYARFEGIIPKGEYGGGTVMVWDIGTYDLIDGNYWQGKLHISVKGKKLKGEWVFVKGHGENGKQNTWYLIKTGTSLPRPSDGEENSSALSGRSLEQIAAAEDAVWHSNKDNRPERPRPGGAIFDVGSLPKVRIGFIEPMLARPVTELPTDKSEWLYELKLDGYRCFIGKGSSKVRLWSRRENLLTHQFPLIARAANELDPGTLLDGEIVALDERGHVSFNLLQHHRLKAHALPFYAFDLLIYKGRSLLSVPLETRREMLKETLKSVGDPIRLSEAFDTEPSDIIEGAKELGFEGIIAKRKTSLYEPGQRTGAWLKYRINRGQEFVIGGYTPGNPFDALIVGYYEGERLLYAGKVRNGFVLQVRRELAKRFKGLENENCPFANLPEKKRTQWALTKKEMENCVWLRPELVAQIEFTEWTPDNHLRHSKFVGLRDDKEPRTVVREAAMSA
jgi:bifunctional non-homologous end joining protein LigD